MVKISEINRLSIKQAEKIRNDLGVTQKFMAASVGVKTGTWGYWVSAKEEIPEDYQARAIETFISLKQLKSGRRLLPVDNGEVDTASRQIAVDAIEVIDTLWEDIKPRISNQIIRRSHNSMIEELKNELRKIM